MAKGVAVLALVAALVAPTEAVAQGAKPSKRCDFTDPAVCLYPWPNDHFTERDRTSATGRRLNLSRASMPRNRSGTPIDPTDMNRGDGFSPGTMLITKVPGLDTPEAAARTRLPPLGNLARGLGRNSPVVVINARTGRRHPIWAEIDANPANARDRVLIIRPGRNFAEGGRYIVALRNLKNARGATIGPSRGFRLYRDRIGTRRRLVEHRRGHFEAIFRSLRGAKIRRRSLYLAWDFTIASRQSLTRRMLHIRDAAFRQLGDPDLGDLQVRGRPPAFTVDLVQDRSPAEDVRIARRVEGTIAVPCYLTNACAPGGRFVLDRRGLPRRRGTARYRYFCNIPRAAVDPAASSRARPAIYGHGLLGNPATEVDAENLKSLAAEHNFVICVTAWAGFSAEDIPHIVTNVLGDLSSFNTLTDRMQQGFLQQLYLGRTLIHPRGFSAHPAFQRNGQSVIDTRRLFYDGNSQGGIQGAALTAVAPDFERAVLGVAGMNYSTLLQRSVDFDAYAQALYPNYPRELERQLWLSQIQLLWDRGEADGYAHHITTRPLPNTPRHEVLMHVAFGDHQVADVTTSIMARTFGARIRRPVLDGGRSPLSNPFFGIRPIRGFPYPGSAVVWWDTGPVRLVDGTLFGTPAPPIANVPPRDGKDPHSAPRNSVSARIQKSEFLKLRGRVVDVCGDRPCYADGYTGSPGPSAARR